MKKESAALRAARERFAPSDTSFIRAAGEGVGPSYQGSKPCVLPLDDPAKNLLAVTNVHQKTRVYNPRSRRVFSCAGAGARLEGMRVFCLLQLFLD